MKFKLIKLHPMTLRFNCFLISLPSLVILFTLKRFALNSTFSIHLIKVILYFKKCIAFFVGLQCTPHESTDVIAPKFIIMFISLFQGTCCTYCKTESPNGTRYYFICHMYVQICINK